jgi:hypothetical protein
MPGASSGAPDQPWPARTWSARARSRFPAGGLPPAAGEAGTRIVATGPSGLGCGSKLPYVLSGFRAFRPQGAGSPGCSATGVARRREVPSRPRDPHRPARPLAASPPRLPSNRGYPNAIRSPRTSARTRSESELSHSMSARATPLERSTSTAFSLHPAACIKGHPAADEAERQPQGGEHLVPLRFPL